MGTGVPGLMNDSIVESILQAGLARLHETTFIIYLLLEIWSDFMSYFMYLKFTFSRNG